MRGLNIIIISVLIIIFYSCRIEKKLEGYYGTYNFNEKGNYMVLSENEFTLYYSGKDTTTPYLSFDALKYPQSIVKGKWKIKSDNIILEGDVEKKGLPLTIKKTKNSMIDNKILRFKNLESDTYLTVKCIVNDTLIVFTELDSTYNRSYWAESPLWDENHAYYKTEFNVSEIISIQIQYYDIKSQKYYLNDTINNVFDITGFLPYYPPNYEFYKGDKVKWQILNDTIFATTEIGRKKYPIGKLVKTE